MSRIRMDITVSNQYVFTAKAVEVLVIRIHYNKSLLTEGTSSFIAFHALRALIFLKPNKVFSDHFYLTVNVPKGILSEINTSMRY